MKFARSTEDDEDLVAAMLLEMDKKETERKELDIRRMRLEKAWLQKPKSTISKHPQLLAQRRTAISSLRLCGFERDLISCPLSPDS